MICRLWRGWATYENAQRYEDVVRSEVIPTIEARDIHGFRKIELLRRELPEQNRVEFMTLMWFDNLVNVRDFTGKNYELAHVPAIAQSVLVEYDRKAAHLHLLDERVQYRRSRQRVSSLELPRSTALLVIDVQQGFVDESWGERNNPGAEENIGALLVAWRTSRRPLHHIHHLSLAPTGMFQHGTVGQEPKVIAVPMHGECVHVKHAHNAFVGTALEQKLREQDIKGVVIAGLTTNHCVSTTARMASDLGFETFVVEDATAAFGRLDLDGRTRSAADVHAAALSDLEGEFAEIVTTENVLAALSSDI